MKKKMNDEESKIAIDVDNSISIDVNTFDTDLDDIDFDPHTEDYSSDDDNIFGY